MERGRRKLRKRRKPRIRSCGGRRKAEKKNEQRSHQRTAAHASETHGEACQCTGKCDGKSLHYNFSKMRSTDSSGDIAAERTTTSGVWGGS